MQSSSDDPTTDPRLRSFVDVRPDSPFPIQNLPYGIFIPASGGPPRVGVAIGEWILDLSVLGGRGLVRGAATDQNVCAAPALNKFMALGRQAWRDVRLCISE